MSDHLVTAHEHVGAHTVNTPIYWLGDNLGLGDEQVTVRTRQGGRLIDYPLEEALRNIDRFSAPRATRILLRLRQHFDMEGDVPLA